jgi:hypothetical protein
MMRNGVQSRLHALTCLVKGSTILLPTLCAPVSCKGRARYSLFEAVFFLNLAEACGSRTQTSNF